jgi:hypothetical protein
MQNPFYELGSTSSSMPFESPLNTDVLLRDYTTNPNKFIASFPTNTSRVVTSTRIKDESYKETQKEIMPIARSYSTIGTCSNSSLTWPKSATLSLVSVSI